MEEEEGGGGEVQQQEISVKKPETQAVELGIEAVAGLNGPKTIKLQRDLKEEGGYKHRPGATHNFVFKELIEEWKPKREQQNTWLCRKCEKVRCEGICMDVTVNVRNCRFAESSHGVGELWTSYKYDGCEPW